MLTPAEVAFRILVGVFVIVAPTILFLLLWRVLMLIRDDRLIERVYAESDEPIRPPQFDLSLLFGEPTEDADSGVRKCVYCGRACGRAICRDCEDVYG